MKNLTVKASSSWFKKSTADASSLSNQEKVAVRAGETFQIKSAFRVGNHCFVELENELAPVGKLGYFFLGHVGVEIDELRGVWLTNTDSEVLSSRGKLEEALKRLKALKFNTLYPVVWQGGYTLYKSSIAESTFGVSIHPKMEDRVEDMVKEIIELGHQEGFRVIPWFEYGLMTLPGSPLAQQKADWLTKDSRGDLIRLKKNGKGLLVPDDHVWLNPCKSEVRKFIADLIGEFIQTYPKVDGIQLDDHFGMPKEMGYDQDTKKLYPNPPKNETEAGWSAWVDWRVGKVTELMREIHSRVKTANKNCLISLSPNPQSFSRRNYLADWSTWEKERLVDELVVQIYRDQTSALEDELKNRSLLEARDRMPTAIGILSGLKGSLRESTLIKEQTEAVQAVNYSGVSYFFYETLVNKVTQTAVAPRDLELSFFV